jgi:hypothetical protein
MNERIKELADETGVKYSLWVGSKPATYMTYDELEKFAELIVKECAHAIAQHNAKSYQVSQPFSIEQVLTKHFGVES